LVLAEKELSFELIEIDLQNKPSWFDAKLSAYGKVPALAHGDVHVWESAVINEYLDEAFPGRPLLPRTPATRARARIQIDYANTRFAPAFGAVLRAENEGASAQLNAALEFIERELSASEGPFFNGNAPGLVDYGFYPWFERWPALAHYRKAELPSAHVRLHGWLSALRARPAVLSQQSPTDFYVERYARQVKRS
jgi:glutathione S-transferase